MTRYFCFLRGINLGRRRVKMDRLRELFVELGFEGVETFIASGNVIFESDENDSKSLESRISGHLEASLGYDVATQIRTLAELESILGLEPFPNEDWDPEKHTVHVTFLPDALPAEAHTGIERLQTPLDRFHCDDRELYWLCLGSVARPSFSSAKLAKLIGPDATARNLQTVQRIVELYRAKG